MHLASPSGTYKLKYDDAKALCISNGARLATYEELLAAFYQGTVKYRISEPLNNWIASFYIAFSNLQQGVA